MYTEEDFRRIREIAKKLGYKKIPNKPGIERLAMRKKSLGSEYLALSMNEYNATLQVENKARFWIEVTFMDEVNETEMIEAESRIIPKERRRLEYDSRR